VGMPRTTHWLPPELPLLDERCPLPLDRPFTRAQAESWGVSRHLVRVLLARGLVRPLVRGAYAARQVRPTLKVRAQALGLVLPPGAVATDRTAAWLHDIDVLPRSTAHEPVPLDVFSAEGSRLRRPGVSSGTRTLLPHDVAVVEGVPVTTLLRTALDLGRSMWRYDAIGALDSFLRAGVDRGALVAETGRFRGHRGVVQLRELMVLADPRAESMPESALRLHGVEVGLDLEPQVWLNDASGHPTYRLDLGERRLRFGVEYHGQRFHLGPDNEARDGRRSAWIDDRDWEIEEFWKADLYAPGADPGARLLSGAARARERLGAWRPEGQYLP
jgi:hypothetical protein